MMPSEEDRAQNDSVPQAMVGSIMTTTHMATLAVVTAAISVGLATLAGPTSAQMPTASVPERQVVGEFAVGGSYANGNTEHRALNLDAKMVYRAGRVQDTYKALFELADNGAFTIAQRWMVGAQSNIDIFEGLYGFGFVNYDDDRFSGYNYELDGGIGAGYRIVETSDILLSVEAGPGYRYSKVPILTGPTEKKLFARGIINFEWLISGTAKLENNFAIFWDSDRSKIENTLALTSKLTRSLSGRFSINVRRNSDPPDLALNKTDTLAKVAIIYSF